MGYGTVARLFHWITVILVLVMILVGFLMVQDLPRPLQDPLFILHKGLGPFVLIFVLARLLWRFFHPAPPLPTNMPPAQVRAAEAVHAGLYILVIVQAISGYVRVRAGGFPIEAIDSIGFPVLIGKSEAVANAAQTVHGLAIYALVALILLHVGAAAYHGLVRQDGIVARMWPPLAPRRR